MHNAHSHSDLSILRHSAAHLLAHAVMELFPDTLLTIGPATSDGFFYDVRAPRSFKEADLEVIAERMRAIVARDLPLTHTTVSKEIAREMFKDNPFKLELIDQIPDTVVGIARQGDFIDLCRGGHVERTGELAYFKLLHLSGSYWRADRNSTPLQRITGTAFWTAEDLAAYEQRKLDLEQYDHRVIGKQLDLFSFHDEGAGFPFFHPKGKAIVTAMMSYMRSLQAVHDYQEISTPTMLSDVLWQRSGHYAHYHDKMYFSCIDDQSYAIKPMNCPGAILTYKTRPRSYRELPLKLAEFGHVHRHELSGVLHGLLRVRAFTQDDAHIFCMPEQLEQEISIIIAMIVALLKKFGFTDYQFALATRPASSLGSDMLWNTAIQALRNALDSAAIPYAVKEGDGAFYGPKIDVQIHDSLGRTWQCSTVQVDFFQPENFDLTYSASTGERLRPVIIHQANYGSLERFLAIILEHYKGRLPLWLAPVQACIMTITDSPEQMHAAQEWFKALKARGMRVVYDRSNEQIKHKIKHASLNKIPWMLIIGKREAEQNVVTLRLHDGSQHADISQEQLWERFVEATR